MIGLDTNVLLRALTNDDAEQSPMARDLLGGLSRDDPGLVNVVVIAELAWVLRTAFAYERLEIADIVDDILSSPAYVVPDRAAVSAALIACRRDGLHLADALIGALNRHEGCTVTLSFDRSALRSALFGKVTQTHAR